MLSNLKLALENLRLFELFTVPFFLSIEGVFIVKISSFKSSSGVLRNSIVEMPGKHIHSQAQEFVMNLLEYFELEKRNGGSFQPLSSVQERVASALKISLKTVYAIKKKKENIPTLSTSSSKKPRLKLKTVDLPEGNKMAVRNTLYNMYEQKKYVTVKTLNDELKNKEIVSIGNTSLLVLLKHLGFKYKKEDNRRALIERTNMSMSKVCNRSAFVN